MIETTNLSKSYNGMKAVDGLNLTIKDGEIFGLLGPNGAGKTTTISMLCTILRPTSGTATVNGFDIIRQPGEVRKSIGIVFQDPSIDDLLTGRENLELHARLYNIPRHIANERITEVLELVELKDRADDVMRQYSGGMRRRLEIARGLIHRPKILFLDEPTLGLDPQTREHIWRYIKDMAREAKITIVLTTHYMEEADMLCDRLAIIDKGKVAVMDTPKKLKELVGGDVVRLKQECGDIRPFKKLKFVKEAELVDGVVSLTVENASKNLPEILRAAGCSVIDVEIRTPTLNDVFLLYTGKEIREESADSYGMMANYKRMHFKR